MEKIIQPTRPVLPDFDEYISEISDIWDTAIMTNNGPKVQKLTDMLKDYIGCEEADVFVNGHSALLIAIQCFELKGQVITSPFTFASTVHSIVQSGLEPVFCDIDDSYNVDVSKLESLITDDTSAILVPHIFGIPCNVEEIERIGQKYNLKVIYDAAQAFGTKINGKQIGVYGDASMFSMHAVKVYNSIEGGLLTYKDSNLKTKVHLYRNFGIESENVFVPGINAKMNEFQAAMGILNLKNLDIEIAKRKDLANYYIENLKQISGIEPFQYKDNIEYNYAYFPVRIKKELFGLDRDTLWIKLKEEGIITRKLYDRLCCDYACYQEKNYKAMVPNSLMISQEALDLPIYGTMKKADIDYICSKIKEIQKV